MDQRTWPTKKLTFPISPRGVTVPFRKREPPFFFALLSPNYRQLASLSPNYRQALGESPSRTERQLLLLKCGSQFAFDFGCGWCWRLGWCRINDGWVGLGLYISNLNLLVAILSLHTLSLEPRFHALIVSYI